LSKQERTSLLKRSLLTVIPYPIYPGVYIARLVAFIFETGEVNCNLARLTCIK
jgi:hypothetical protein